MSAWSAQGPSHTAAGDRHLEALQALTFRLKLDRVVDRFSASPLDSAEKPKGGDCHAKKLIPHYRRYKVRHFAVCAPYPAEYPSIRIDGHPTGKKMKVLVEKRDQLTTVIINRPDQRNAVDRETSESLRQAFSDFEQDQSSHVAVLCGTGNNFCAGYDLKSVSAGSGLHQPDGEGPMGPTRTLMLKPVIAAIEGYAVAGGLELALWCDMRIASKNAVFGVFCRRWGVPLIDGGTIRLPRLIGHSRALDMILTGRPVGADEALSFGLANRVVAAGMARLEAEALALQIASFPQICMRADRLSSYRQWGSDLADALRTEAHGGEGPLITEAVNGATRFAKGLGRSGDFTRICRLLSR